MDPCYVLAQSSVKLCPTVMWKAEFVIFGYLLEGYLLEGISKESGEGMTWFPLAAYSKM